MRRHALTVIVGCAALVASCGTSGQDQISEIANGLEEICRVGQANVDDLLADYSDANQESILDSLGLPKSNRFDVAVGSTSIDVDDFHVCNTYIESTDNVQPALEYLESEIGLSSAVGARMASTSALDGNQQAETDGWVLYWGYHPDRGLDVVLELVED